MSGEMWKGKGGRYAAAAGTAGDPFAVGGSNVGGVGGRAGPEGDPLGADIVVCCDGIPFDDSLGGVSVGEAGEDKTGKGG